MKFSITGQSANITWLEISPENLDEAFNVMELMNDCHNSGIECKQGYSCTLLKCDSVGRETHLKCLSIALRKNEVSKEEGE